MKSINKKQWESLPESEQEQFVKFVFDSYRKTGFPYLPTNKSWRHNEYAKLKRYDYRKLYQNESIGQSMHGLSLAWSYMPHAFSVQCNNKLTPLQVFNDDELFMRVIKKRMKMGDNISDSGIRKMLKMFSGTQAVSNFRPTAAAVIYDLFTSSNSVVWDMSSGYGGRLLGASLHDIHYIGTDPCTETYNGLCEIKDDFGINAELYKIGSEDFIPDKNSLDFCFTSPPYFDTEKYSDEQSQSYIKYPSIELWLNGFITSTIKNCWYGLHNGGILAINIADIKQHKIEQPVIDIIEKIGFKRIGMIKYLLSKMGSGYKFEPIYIFKKR